MAAEFVDYIQKIIKLQKREYNLIRDFDYRWKLLLRHEQLALSLIDKTEDFFRNPTRIIADEISLVVKDLQTHITLSLRYVSDSDLEDIHISRVVSEETQDWDEAILKLERDVVEIRRNADLLPDGEVKHALVVFLNDLEKEKEIAEKETKINSYLEKLLEALRTIIEEEKEILEQDLGLLQQVYTFNPKIILNKEIVAEELKTHVRQANTKLRENIKALQNVFSKEKGRVINPYTALIDQKSIVIKTLEKRKAQKVLTTRMIKSDLKQLSPPQAERYLALLEETGLSKLEDASLKFYLRFKRFFIRKRDKRKYAREDILTATIEDMKQKLQYDTLMGVGNKEYFRPALLERIASITRNGGIVSLLYFDLDKFKDINDAYGHPAGDEVLKAVGEVTRDSVSAGDIICRIGGEEIAVIFKEVSSFSQAQQHAESIRVHIETECKRIIVNREAYSSIKSIQRDLQSGKKNITISGGLASIEISKTFLDEKSLSDIAARLIEIADKKLYDAKHSGRNKILSGSFTYLPRT